MTHRVATPTVQAVTIPAGGGMSEAIDLKELVPIAIQFPSAWTAADLVPNGRLVTKTPSGADVPWGPLYDDLNTEITIKASTSRVVRLDEKLLWGVASVKFSTSNSQGADRLLLVSLLPRAAVMAGMA